jgi:hypothetical protein
MNDVPVKHILIAIHLLVSTATQIFLIFFDGVVYNWWNWLIIIPTSFFQGEIWPIYWLIIRPLFH